MKNDTGLEYMESKIRNVPDFPTKGILFKDVTPLLADRRAFGIAIGRLTESLSDAPIDLVVGMEARGLIFGAPVADRLCAGFVPARKAGKLPADVDRIVYETEYSKTELEMHRGCITKGARVVIIDDVLATGGTAEAAGKLVELQGGVVVAFAFLIELTFLPGRTRLVSGAKPARVESVLSY